MIDDLVNDLVRDEGSITNDRGRHIVYDCPAGLKTIGYGIEVESHGLSEKEARTTGTGQQQARARKKGGG